MKLSLSKKNACSLSIVLVSARIFSHLAIDGGDMGNAAWICALLGAILVLPLGIIADVRPSLSEKSFPVKAGLLVICIIGIFEGAAVLGLITDTIKCSGMLRASSAWIATTTLLGCLYAVFKNGDGLCNGVRIWIFAFIALLAVIVITQARFYRPGWLLPILGPGVGKLAAGTASAAGIASFAPLIHMLAEPDDDKGMCCTKSLIISGIAAAILCAMKGMMAPVLVGTDLSRFHVIDELIANGRQSLSLRLPLLTVIYGGYISSIAGYCFAASAALQKCFGKMSGKVCAIVIIGAVYAVNVSGIAARKGILMVSGWEFVAAAVAAVSMRFPGMKRAVKA